MKVIINRDIFTGARTAKHLTLEKLAKQLDVTHSFLSMVANGKTTLSIEMFMQLTKILEVPGKLLAKEILLPKNTEVDKTIKEQKDHAANTVENAG